MDEIKAQFLALFKVMASNEVTDSIADFTWGLYCKLIAKGFTTDQAMKIVSGMSKGK